MHCLVLLVICYGTNLGDVYYRTNIAVMFYCIHFGEVCYRTTIEEPHSVAFQVTYEQVRFIDHRSTDNMNNHDAVEPS